MQTSIETAESIAIDPLARVEPGVQLSPPARIAAGAVLRGDLIAGPGLVVHPGATLGSPAQHRERGSGALRLGEGVEVWDCATIHAGSVVGARTTQVGDRVIVMAYSHIGHDAVIGNDVVITNGAQIGGHVEIADGAVLGARSAVHQFTRIGRGAMVAAGSFVVSDVPPWALVAGDRARILGANRVALGSPERSGRIRRGLRMLRSRSVTGADLLEELGSEHGEVRDLAAFVDAESRRGICR